MPPRQFSRHTFTVSAPNSAAQLFLDEREPFRFKQFRDNRRHIVVEGETLFALAGRFFKPLVRPSGLWWVIADFQPQPIFDPTIKLTPGSVLVVPSVRTVTEEILNEKRRTESIP